MSQLPMQYYEMDEEELRAHETERSKPKPKPKPKRKGPLTLGEVNYIDRRRKGVPRAPFRYGPGQLGVGSAACCMVCGRSDILLHYRESGKPKCMNCVGISTIPAYSVENMIYGDYNVYDKSVFDMKRHLAQCPQPADIEPVISIEPSQQYLAIAAPPEQQYLAIAPPSLSTPLAIAAPPQYQSIQAAPVNQYQYQYQSSTPSQYQSVGGAPIQFQTTMLPSPQVQSAPQFQSVQVQSYSSPAQYQSAPAPTQQYSYQPSTATPQYSYQTTAGH